MERYINADKMIADTKAMKNVAGSIEIDGIVKYIEEHIAADVQEVKHAHWRIRNWETEYGDRTPNYYICSNCDVINDLSTRYCPNCGAKMDKLEGK